MSELVTDGTPSAEDIREFEQENARRRMLPDSGERESFGEGLAIREADPDKPAVEGISPFMILRLGTHLTNGGKKYGDFRNWEKGMPFTRCIGAIVRHIFQYLARDESEDHLAAVAWNVMALIHYEETKPELDDRPVWPRKKETE